MIQKPVIQLNYEKRKNTKLFDQFRKADMYDFHEIQNYIPIYNKFFDLNETNYNSFNLNNPFYLREMYADAEANANIDTTENDDNNFNVVYKLRNKDNDELIQKEEVYVKCAPVLDPFKYFIGKYNFNVDECKMPTFGQDENNHIEFSSKVYDANNSAYVDGFFSYLSGEVLHNYKFVHGLEFYGTYFGIKNNFKVNVIYDIDYLCKSDYFMAHNGTKFFVDDYSKVVNLENSGKLPHITIDHSKRENISASSIKDELFENIFENGGDNNNAECVLLEEVNDDALLLTDTDTINENERENTNANITSLKSTSTCSSRASFTDDEAETDDDNDEDEDVDCKDEEKDCDDDDIEEDCKSSSDSEMSEEEPIFATIPKFPVNVICMEKCEDTMDNLILNDEIKSMGEWFAILMQIIMTLIAYQKCFAFTHNDLHTNNIMYIRTEKKFLYYCYNSKHYKVPTYGRIFKIIDFGRSIYKMNNRVFCSDSFKKGEDAATQYNVEPYFNDNKPRIEPNYSFDLCRLACSIFDYIVEDIGDVQKIHECSPIVRLIVEWCMDDNGLNVLYKSNGDERYEEFKLYKMIARCVHKHTPQNQLERAEFSNFCVDKKKVPKDDKKNVMNIDLMPVC